MSEPVTLIKVRGGDPVRINCPSERKFPAFHKSFHGRAGKVLAVEPKGAPGIVVVDISTEAEKNVWIYVDRAWLSHREGRRVA